jgi:hypothetical protein
LVDVRGRAYLVSYSVSRTVGCTADRWQVDAVYD